MRVEVGGVLGVQVVVAVAHEVHRNGVHGHGGDGLDRIGHRRDVVQVTRAWAVKKESSLL